VRPIPSLDLSSPEVHVRPYLIQAAEMGVSSHDLGYTVNALIDGAYAGDYYIGGDKIDLTITGRTEGVRNAQDVEALPIATPFGQLVPLGALAEVSLSSGPEQVNHRERQRAITIQVTPSADMPLEQAMIQIRDEIVRPMQESGQLDGGYRIVLAGTADKLSATWKALRFNVVLALLITYLLMAALFESWLYPLVIIFCVPLGAVGGIAGLQLLNQFVLQPLDILTMLGFVILIGTVVNNPILIVHQSLNLTRDDGLSPRDAILESVRTRIRPIFMTTLTTVLGLLPLVLFPGAGSELYRGLGSVVLGGLLVSTVFTLVLVPTLFSLVMDAKRRVVGDAGSPLSHSESFDGRVD
jgi:HAE1 family hydrophobic/amphiphilic exporter-1